MNPFEMVVMVVGMGCATGVFCTALVMMKDAIVARRGRAPDELTAELRALREEMKQVRQQNADVILSLDTTFHQVDQRLSHLETRSQLGAAYPQSEEIPQVVGRR